MASPRLQDLARAAIAPRAAGDLRLAQALEIVGAYGEARAARVPGSACDSASLPYPKETVKWALLVVLGAIDDPAGREPLKTAFVGLGSGRRRRTSSRHRSTARGFASASIRWSSRASSPPTRHRSSASPRR